jgi:hypothetical protein
MTGNHSATALRDLDRGFRASYLTYAELTAQVQGWAEAFPEICRVSSIGTSTEGRALWLLTIGPDPDRARPAVWVDGNMHAGELCGSSVALAIAETMLRVHLGVREDAADLPAPVLDRLRDVLFYVLPRMCPDGAECILTTGRYVRSNPRNERPNRNLPYWQGADVDGDGLILKMRVEDPGGEFVESSEVPGLLVLRRIDDPPPYYKVYPEGYIENFDGHTVPSPSYLSDNQTDLNRNFPWSWAPEHQQIGAGAFPLSEPESRAVVEFSSHRPHIFAWLNLHTFGGVFIRPHGHKPDNKMDPDDLALYRQIGAWAEELTGYPMVSGFEEFTYEPDKPLHGDLSDYAYEQRGCVAYVVELWDIFKQLDIGQGTKRFVERYTRLTRDDMIKVARWDREHNQSRVMRPWQRCRHEQLGEVEVGGVDSRFGLSNPPFERLAEICTQHSAAFMRVAALAPAPRFGAIERRSLEHGLTRVTITVENRGYLPTYVLSSARKLDFCEPLYAEVQAHEGCALDHPGDARREIGHLDGWGRGLYDGSDAIYYLSSRGNTGSRTLSYVVRGHGRLSVRVGSCRTGWMEQEIEITG